MSFLTLKNDNYRLSTYPHTLLRLLLILYINNNETICGKRISLKTKILLYNQVGIICRYVTTA